MKTFFSILTILAFGLFLTMAGCSKNATTPETEDGNLPDCESMLDQFSCQDCDAEGILFSRNLDELIEAGGRSEVFVWSDNQVTRITDNLIRNENPVWVPFKQAFIDVTRDYSHYYLEIACAGGEQAAALFPDLPDDFDYIYPSSSWDGREICFIKRVRAGGFNGMAVVYHADTSSFDEYDLGEYGSPRTAKISPNGRYIACTTFSSRIFLIDTAGGEVRLLAEAESGSPAFSPNSRQIVYSRENEQNQYAVNLWLQDIQTGHRRQLTTKTTVKDYDACFSPDGRQIVFARRMLPDYGSEIYHLWLLNLNDMSEVQITDGRENDRDPHWR